ncbi:MAG: hypothetical protein IJX67_09010 [Oscillospiraceae bacterium]|nr:hypothetical protein [Oscillospiraceae bacterium]
MTLKVYGKVPNLLIDDVELPHIAKQLATALIFAAKGNIVRGMTIRRLAKLCHCTTGTAQKHLGTLEQKGYITKRRSYRYSLSLGRCVYAANEYELTLPTEGGYTLIPRSILRRKVTGSCFTVMLCLYRRAGRDGRAYPSIRYIAGARKDKLGGCGVSKASVCRALQLLKKLRFFISLPCERRRGDLSCNSYLLTAMVGVNARAAEGASAPSAKPLVPLVAEGTPDPASCLGGGLKIDTLDSSNKITGDSYLEEKDKGVFKFGTLYKTLDRLRKGFSWLRKRLRLRDTS